MRRREEEGGGGRRREEEGGGGRGGRREGRGGRERGRREREKKCKIPVYNTDSQSYPDEINPQSNPLTHSLLPLCDQAVCPVWLGPVLSQCHSASLHPLMHLEHSCAH